MLARLIALFWESQPVIAFGMGVLALVSARLVERWWKASRRRRVREYAYDLEALAMDALRARLAVIEIDHQLAEHIQNMPEDFDPAVLEAMRIGYAFEYAVRMRAQELGIPSPSNVKPMSVETPPVIEVPAASGDAPAVMVARAPELEQHKTAPAGSEPAKNGVSGHHESPTMGWYHGGGLGPSSRNGAGRPS